MAIKRWLTERELLNVMGRKSRRTTHLWRHAGMPFHKMSVADPNSPTRYDVLEVFSWLQEQGFRVPASFVAEDVEEKPTHPRTKRHRLSTSALPLFVRAVQQEDPDAFPSPVPPPTSRHMKVLAGKRSAELRAPRRVLPGARVRARRSISN